MSNFYYQPIFERGVDHTSYRHLTVEGISTVKLGGRELLKVEPTVLQLVARTAFDDVAHMLELQRELMAGLDMVTHGLAGRCVIQPNGPVLVVPGQVRSQTAFGAVDVEVLVIVCVESDGNLRNPTVWEDQLNVGAIVNLLTRSLRGKDFDRISAEGPSGVVNVVARQVEDAAAARKRQTQASLDGAMLVAQLHDLNFNPAIPGEMRLKQFKEL